jgi:DNA-binding NtrC family response regulator
VNLPSLEGLAKRAAGRRTRPLIAVVDDDPDVRGLVATALDGAGYDVIEASDGEEALRLVEESPPRLLLLDIQMPNLDGPALVHELRSRLHELPVVVMTGRPHPAREADRCNAVASLAKPFDMERLVGLVRRFAR